MKAKRNFIALSFLFISCFGKAQDNTADSLKSLLSAAKQDSNKVKLLLVLSEYYLNSSPEEAKRISLQAFDLAGLLKYPSGQALALKDIGGAYYFLGNTSSALQSFSESMRVYDSLHDLVGKGVILNNIGTVYYQNGSANKALEYYFKSLDIAQKIGDKAGVAAAFTNIGNVYNSKRATRDKALGYYLQALHLSEEIGDKNNLGAVSVNLGEIYFDLNKDDSALFYFQESLMAYANTINIPYPQRDIGRLYAKKGLYSSAIQWEQQSYEMAKKFDSKLYMTQSLKELGDTYFSKGEYNSALHSYKQADSIAAIIPAYKELGEAYGGLAKTYSKLGDFASAYFYQMLFSGVADTLNNQTLADQLTAMQKSYEIQTSQNEIQSLTKDKQLQELDLKSQKIQKAFITAGLVLIFIIAFVIYRNYRSKAKTNIILDKQKVEIEGLLLNILPGEVADELQRTGSSTPRYYEHVSVLFTDFKGFTKLADAMSPQEVVSELNNCFMAFDDIMEKYHLEKIKTIGDSYMCAGGIPTPDEKHPENIIKAGMEIRDTMFLLNSRRRELGLPTWELRIGIHIGPVVAGVVGRKKYAYDIWGSTVNIASRMESNGEPGQINISAATYELVKHKYNCSYRGKIFAKNIGEIDMYFVDGEVHSEMELPHADAQGVNSLMRQQPAESTQAVV